MNFQCTKISIQGKLYGQKYKLRQAMKIKCLIAEESKLKMQVPFTYQISKNFSLIKYLRFQRTKGDR
jgi:hypothetical protein